MTRGFSLAELLVALLILAQIATFTIPKVLHAQQDARRTVILKETYAAISEITYRGYYIEKKIDTSTNGSYILNHLNAVKLCNSNSLTQGCWMHSHPSGWEIRVEPGAVLANGATIAGLNDAPAVDNEFIIDWNGPELPNLEGEDQLKMWICEDTVANCGSIKKGTIGSHSSTSRAFISTIFSP